MDYEIKARLAQVCLAKQWQDPKYWELLPPEQTGVEDGVETAGRRRERKRKRRKIKSGGKKHSFNKSSSFSLVFYTRVPEFLHIRAKPQGHLRAQPLWAAGGTPVCGKERKKAAGREEEEKNLARNVGQERVWWLSRRHLQLVHLRRWE